jgi:protein-S-isoprenylcysteine O-methyltransferase Ste14
MDSYASHRFFSVNVDRNVHSRLSGIRLVAAYRMCASYCTIHPLLGDYIAWPLIPLLFEAYATLVLFSMLNAWMLFHRIRIEERGLSKYTDYASVMSKHSRFIPKNPEQK